MEQAETVAAHVQSDNLVAHVRQCISTLSEHVTCTVTLLVLGFDKLMKSKRKGFVILYLIFVGCLIHILCQNSKSLLFADYNILRIF